MNIQQEINNLINYFLGAKYYKAITSLNTAIAIHNGFRKDGVTPEYEHQVKILSYLRSIESLLMYDAENYYIAASLHDTLEDHPDKINSIFMLETYGENILKDVELLTKTGKETKDYYKKIESNPIASIVKGADRMHNYNSMVGVFSKEKIEKYILEGRDYVLPMLENSKFNFPKQEKAYTNIILILESQMKLVEGLL